jgi:hypothetical protein
MTYLTEKMRKRDMAANAVLAAGLIGNLQSPQHIVRSGHIEAPGVQLMQRMMKKRKEANRNLDSGVVSQGARNRTNVSAPSARKRMAAAYDRMRKQKREKADEIIRDLRKEQKTFQDFMLECYELEESSTGERMGRGKSKLTQFGNLKIKGQARSPVNTTTRRRRSVAAIAKKAGLKGTGKLSHHDIKSSPRDYDTYDSEDELDDIGSTKQDHFIRTYKSPRRAASGEHLISKYRGYGGVNPSKDSVRKVRDFKKSMTKAGANKKGRVHAVDIIHRDSEVFKGDKTHQMERGRNFIAAVKDTPNQLKKAGAKKGEAVVGKPSAVMDGEDSKTGQAKRAKLYKKIFKGKSTKKSEKTGIMTGKID